jgi:hypothetical protein
MPGGTHAMYVDFCSDGLATLWIGHIIVMINQESIQRFGDEVLT